MTCRVAGRKFYRELPFLFNDGGQLIQGVLDLLIDTPDGAEIVDYKTGEITPDRRAAYKLQLDVYARAVETVLKKSVARKSVFLIRDAEFLEF